MSSPTPSQPSATISSDALAEAAERRTRLATPQLTAAQLAAEHERRQKFRRLIDPGITRPNAKERALSSLKTLLAISENLLREPDNPKFQQFKPTNTIIKRDLVDPKGALEFAIELGFRPEVHNFQPYYTFHPQHIEDLRTGAAVLKEHLDLENEKQERAERAKKNEKDAREAAAAKVKLAYIDDRRTKILKDELEKEQRAARALAAADRAAVQATREESEAPETSMPGSGHILGLTSTDDDAPPAYDNHRDSD
ncbi:hypothetical protein CPB84DRAFT_1757953 [Gymnopilus junonius]|uniref:PUB domain-containing protein n=1 Tax=Gymnopilus junonius TaxID=109634 RepID=A0A9P5TU80_GYMJU|nr:hypothetical protein CPB84DRAFT_1757953 [Gymnopilus junonius]